MFEDHAPIPFLSAPPPPPSAAAPDALTPLHGLLVGDLKQLASLRGELPALPDLLAGALALASGRRRRVVLPLPRAPLELALVRSGDAVLVDCYGTEDVPEILVREHRITLAELLESCAQASLALSEQKGDDASGRALRSLRERVLDAVVRKDPHAQLQAIRCAGGSLASPGLTEKPAFGFQIEIMPAVDRSPEPHAFADVHALLFDGTLWVWNGDKRIDVVSRGPVMLAAKRMVAAVRALLEAYQAERPLYVRLRNGSFAISMRRSRGGPVALTLSEGRKNSVTFPALEVADAALPILRLASDLIRKLIAVDRRQTHNLRVSSLRAEIRRLRAIVRARSRNDRFENHDPERLRASTPEQQRISSIPPDPAFGTGATGLRYTERFRVEIDGLDASAIYLCGDRLVVAAQKLTLALARSDGQMLWSQPSAGASTLMAERTLVRVLSDGQLELHEVEHGECFARSQIAPRAGNQLVGMAAGGGDLPPMAILVEGRQSLCAIDLRNAQPRWRRRVRGDYGTQLVRAGRVLLVSSGDGALDAIDVANGEVVWRFSDGVRFCLPPALCGETVVALSGEPGGGGGAVYGLDLYTGRLAFQRELPAAPSAEPIAVQGMVIVPYGRSRSARLCALDARSGAEHWDAPDPGLDNGAKTLCLDDALIINSPSGRVVALDLQTGAPRWSRALANPLTDDVPRQLEPLLRQGGLFVPSAQAHVLRPSDGTTLTDVSCDLVPDCLRVDERGYCYVAEESGHLRAYAPAPQLRLVR